MKANVREYTFDFFFAFRNQLVLEVGRSMTEKLKENGWFFIRFCVLGYKDMQEI